MVENILLSAFLNMGAVLLGFVSWLCAGKAMGCAHDCRKGTGWSLSSFLFCAVALLFQVLEMAHRAWIGDMSAILDTIGAVAAGAGILVLITAVLNLLAYRNYTRKNESTDV